MAGDPRILIREKKRKGPAPLPPSDTRGLAPFLIAGGLALAIAGWTDLALFYYPSQFSSREWEFGVIARSFDAMPLPTMGLLLLVLGVRARGGSRRVVRGLAVVLAIVAVACVAALALFSLDIPMAMRAVQRASTAQAANSLMAAGLERAMAKVILFSTAYAASYGWMAVKLWRVVPRI